MVDEEVKTPLLPSPRVLEVLIVEVKNVLKELSRNSNLQQFVYNVDLLEKNWQYFIEFQNYEILAVEVIIREAQKVYLRELFK